jgi:drug/metabolite transporter (DMT)-like permease
MLPWTRRAPHEPPLSAHDRRLLFWESFLGNFLFSICMLYGVLLTSAVAAGVTMAAIPATVALMSWWWLGERPGRRVIAAIACAMAGIAWLALVRGGEDHGRVATTHSALPRWLGPLLLLGAVVCEASYVVIGKRLAASVPPRRISALINLWGLVLVTPLGLWQALSFDFAAVPAATWGLLVFYALAASVITVWLWMKGLMRVPAQRAGVFSVLLPVSAAAVGVLFLGEPFGAGHAVALGLALAGVLLAVWPSSSNAGGDPHA